MKTIIIDNKEYKVVAAVAEEFNWLNIKLNSAKNIIKQIEDLEDELDTQLYIHAEKKQKLINEIKEL